MGRLHTPRGLELSHTDLARHGPDISDEGPWLARAVQERGLTSFAALGIVATGDLLATGAHAVSGKSMHSFPRTRWSRAHSISAQNRSLAHWPTQNKGLGANAYDYMHTGSPPQASRKLAVRHRRG